MRKNRVSLLRFLTIVGCASFFVGCATTIRLNSQFDNRRFQLHTVSAMPCESNITLVKFKGDNDRMKDEESRVCGNMRSAITAEPRRQGFIVLEQSLNTAIPDSLMTDEIRFKLTQIQQDCDRAFAKMYNRPTSSKACTLSLGSDVTLFADQMKSDALVFVRMNGFKGTSKNS